jgi:hypothetical protein
MLTVKLSGSVLFRFHAECGNKIKSIQAQLSTKIKPSLIDFQFAQRLPVIRNINLPTQC